MNQDMICIHHPVIETVCLQTNQCWKSYVTFPLILDKIRSWPSLVTGTSHGMTMTVIGLETISFNITWYFKNVQHDNLNTVARSCLWGEGGRKEPAVNFINPHWECSYTWSCSISVNMAVQTSNADSYGLYVQFLRFYPIHQNLMVPVQHSE